MNEMIKVGVQSLHSPKNIPNHCLFSALKCFVNESLLLKPAHGKNENLFNTTLSRIHSSQRNVERILSLSVQNCYSCVDYPKQSEKIFLRDFKSLLQRLYQTAL
ncbi:interleukin-21 [Liasis olivaceus]